MKVLAMGLVFLLALVVFCGAQEALGQTGALKPNLGTTTSTKKTSMPASYWVTYNTKIRPGQDMVFNVLIINGSSPVSVTASLLDNAGAVALTSDAPITCLPGTLGEIHIKIPYDVSRPGPERWNNQFKVQVVGVGNEVSFNESNYVTLQEKPFSIYVQTDKAMYKPRQEVKFRVAAVTPQLQMMKDAKYDIVVKDAKDNRILQFLGLNASTTMGVVQQSFQLANNVPMGDWSIEATVKGYTETKTFTVSEYILPKFEVEIDMPPFGLSDEDYLYFTVGGKYTFGKPVTDSAVMVEIEVQGYAWRYREKAKPKVRRRGMLGDDGKILVKVSTTELLALVQDSNPRSTKLEWDSFLTNATITEARTRKMRSSVAEITYYATPLKMEFLPITPKANKAGLNFTAFLEVKKRDDSLFTTEEAKAIQIQFNVTYKVPMPPEPEVTLPPRPIPRRPGNETAKEEPILLEEGAIRGWYPRTTYVTKILLLPVEQRLQQLTDNGLLIVRFGIPDEATSIEIEAKSFGPFNKSDTTRFYADQMHSPSDTFLQLNVTNNRPKVNDKVKVKAKATEVISVINYQISSKGVLLLSKRFVPPKPGKEIEFEFDVLPSMSPNLNLLVFYVRADGEFVVDALSMSVEGLFPNPVDIKFSKNQVKPGESVDVIVRGQEESMVFLLAVDKSVKLLKSGNDITLELVRQELLKYEHNGWNYGFWRYMVFCGSPFYNAGTDAASVFSSAGVVVLTDGELYRRETFYGGPVFFRSAAVMDNVAVPTAAQGKPEDSAAPVKVRKLFPENWLWDALTIPSSGEVRVNLKAPDTITSWIASAFSAHPTSGLSVAADTAQVTTFRDLFVSVNLPSSIVRGESFCFVASVFSYYAKPISVSLTLDASTDFTSIYTKRKANNTIVQEEERLYYTIIVGEMKNGDIKSKTFCFTPKELGVIPVRVVAETTEPGLSDAVEHMLRVRPEGVPRTTSKPYMVELKNGRWDKAIQVGFPPNSVKGSERITVNIAGNFLGPVFKNMDSLIKQPYGCGEQNMINFAPLMSLMRFFYETGLLTDEIEKEISKYVLKGYQKELDYEHGKTGAFSAFGDRRGDPGSTWLSAFVLKCFAQAESIGFVKESGKKIVDIQIVNRTAFFVAQQEKGGSFYERGKVFNKQLQGDSGSGVALTAYSLIALHEASLVLDQTDKSYKRIETAITNGRNRLESQVGQFSDPYDVCITAYALNLLKSTKSQEIFNLMQSIAVSGSGLKYWKRPEKEPASTYKYYWTVDSTALSVEMTAYAFLTYSVRGIAISQGLGILNWLSKQRNPAGGFISTQDTVIGIEALTKVAAELYKAEYIPMTIKATAGDSVKNFNMAKENEMLLQTFTVPLEDNRVKYMSAMKSQFDKVSNGQITMEAMANQVVDSSTTVLVEVVMSYNVEQESQNNVYKVDHRLDEVEMFLKISTVNGQDADMTLVKIELPAGISVDVKEVENFNRHVSRAEMEGEETLILYFNTGLIGVDGVQVHVPFDQTGGTLTSSKPKYITVLAYYDPTSDLTFMYSIKDGDICTKMPNFQLCGYGVITN